ncbi:tetratricopeptide repeat protein [Novipirellula artificiosorum]|uniref:Outer membrane protein assembly factor BamD n=1 Tax=Novipirellula artificiosorum TaxID=2528016 RepID=A0A5C6DM28_9BACT|nr:tetratricopeptide repeat protein [Novipirellula artificiosorum]TWU37194.1 hypothetical protein Poly41_33210 [Novipirellula artificiosorum]
MMRYAPKPNDRVQPPFADAAKFADAANYVGVVAMISTALLFAGCQTFRGLPGPFGSTPEPVVPNPPSDFPVKQASFGDSARKTTNQVVNFVTMREQEDTSKAKTLYQQGDVLFQEGGEQYEQESERGRAESTFFKAAKLFRRAGEAAPGTALQQDAMFMQAESLFFANRLPDAAEVYGKLQKQFPRNRHNDLVTARQFNIARYWIDTEKATEGKWRLPNLSDYKRPVLDADGHAIRLLDQLRYDDPTGRLADDATMAAAAEQIRQGKYDKADEFLTDLRETYTDSDHLFLAHLMGINCKLEIYAGPQYSGLILDEADKLVQQTRTRFPDKMQDPQYADHVARAAAKIAYHQAERLAYRAEYREKKKEYGAARVYYNELLTLHQNTPHADNARERLAAIEDLPAVPQQRLSWLTTVFPDSKASTPLEATFRTDGDPDVEPESKTLLR